MPHLPKYPVYVISKGRWESRLTSRALEWMGVPYRIVVEPQEFDSYASVISPKKILALPFSNLGQGSIPARNFVWDHSIQQGAERHWIIDDNIRGFWRLHENSKIPVRAPSFFRAIEDFVDRYENIAMAGPHYYMFAPRKTKMPPFNWNRRIYSCILLRNDLPYRWRGRYNEDTDLSLRILKDGYDPIKGGKLCTVIFCAFLAQKITTMLMKGGNTEELYQKSQNKENDGRYKMALSLCEQHPDVARINWKWGRWQHEVDYRPFEINRPILKSGIEIPETCQYEWELKVSAPKSMLKMEKQDGNKSTSFNPTVFDEVDPGRTDDRSGDSAPA